MSRWVLSLGLLIAVSVALSFAQSSDPELNEGVRLVRQGEYGQAIILLDRAAKRLAQKSALRKEAAQAYLQLGIAYVGQDQETLAKASFREAVAQDESLELNAFDESPKVRELFQKAKDELAQQKKGRRKALPILLGIGAAGGIGAAVAAGGGSGQSTTPPSGRRTETFNGFLALEARNVEFPVPVTQSGLLEAELMWPEATARLHLALFDATAVRPPFNNLADSPSVRSGSPQFISYSISPGNYKLGVTHRLPENFPPPFSTSAATYTLRVTYPQAR